MITLAEAKKRQSELQSQGERLLKTIPIERLFGRYGEYKIGGSFLARLMVKPDIDGYILVGEAKLEDGLALVRDLMAMSVVHSVMIERQNEATVSGQVVSNIALKVKLRFEDRLWNVDVHLVRRQDAGALDYLGSQTYTPAQHDAMLLLKAQLKEMRLYPASTKWPGSFASVDVYQAVLEDGVNSLEDMIEWGNQRETAADSFREHQEGGN